MTRPAHDTKQDIITRLIEEAGADHNALSIERLTDNSYGISDQEYGTRHVVCMATVSKALTRWARAVTHNPGDYCNAWVVAATAAKHDDWAEFDYDATIATRVIRIACGDTETD